MKTRGVLSQVLFLAALALVITFTGACATLPQQTRPTSPELFYGQWAGTWQSYNNPASTGTVEVEILADAANRPNRASFNAKQTNAVVPGFSAGGVFRDGEIAFESAGGSTLQFVLYGQDRIEATYYNPNNQDRGVWMLTRKVGVTSSPTALPTTGATPTSLDASLQWLVGSWKGEQKAGVYTSPLTVTVSADASWKLDLVSERSGRVSGSGKVAPSDGRLVFRGTYDGGPSHLIGRAVYYEFERTAEGTLIGWGQGVAEPFSVELKKAK